jgi:hypothetical protein
MRPSVQTPLLSKKTKKEKNVGEKRRPVSRVSLFL